MTEELERRVIYLDAYEKGASQDVEIFYKGEKIDFVERAKLVVVSTLAVKENSLVEEFYNLGELK